jgi:hypothetical protein
VTRLGSSLVDPYELDAPSRKTEHFVAMARASGSIEVLSPTANVKTHAQRCVGSGNSDTNAGHSPASRSTHSRTSASSSSSHTSAAGLPY